MNFLGKDNKATNYAEAKVVVLSAPYEATCTFGSGTAKGPEAILSASPALETYDEELDRDLAALGIATLAPFSIQDLEPETMVEAVAAGTLPVVLDKKIPAGLGGEHTVTLGFLKAVLKGCPDVTALQIDAHPDLRQTYQGRTVCHATVGARMAELCPVVQVGLRAFTHEEKSFLQDQHTNPSGPLHPFSAHYIHRNPSWTREVVDALGDEVYVTVDLDGFDPSLLPHTGTPEPNGLSWRQVCDLLAAVASAPALRDPAGNWCRGSCAGRGRPPRALA